ncbi:hypothetical protein V8E53_011531 [Lactarius tabidus]
MPHFSLFSFPCPLFFLFCFFIFKGTTQSIHVSDSCCTRHILSIAHTRQGPIRILTPDGELLRHSVRDARLPASFGATVLRFNAMQWCGSVSVPYSA